MDRLTGIDAKLNRAQEQIRALVAFPGAWTAGEQPYALEPQIDEGKRRYIWAMVERKPIPPDPAVASDEVVHHLRSVLDHLACHLVEACGSKPTQATQWPIEGSPFGWKRNVERRRHRWQVWRKKRGGPLGGIPRNGPIWTFIEDAQPYKAGGQARDHPLFALNANWNANKHRILNPLWFEGMPSGDPIDLFDVAPRIEPVESRWIMQPGHKLEHGTKIALFVFPSDQPLPVMTVKVNCQIPIQVATGDDDGTAGFDMQDTLNLIRQLVADAIALRPR